MKTRFLTFCAFFALLMTVACKQDANPSEFDVSYNAWLKFKKESQNSYNYMVGTSSLSGHYTETVLYVQNGKVIKRSFKAGVSWPPAPPPGTVQEEWTEEGGSLSTHQKGAPTKTLDEIYADLKSNWLVKRNNATTYFETHNDGMVSLAGYTENGCMDDCFNGISIRFIVKINYN